MIINSLDKKCVLSISIIRNSGQSYKMKIYAKLRDRETDTDITYSTISCMYPRDLHYILDCYKNISEDKSSFGFTSCDQAINFGWRGQILLITFCYKIDIIMMRFLANAN